MLKRHRRECMCVCVHVCVRACVCAVSGPKECVRVTTVLSISCTMLYMTTQIRGHNETRSFQNRDTKKQPGPES